VISPRSDLSAAFVRTLEEYLAGGDGAEAALLSAYELGRRALAEGLGVLDVAGLLHDALVAACRGRPDSAETIRAAEGFALECLSSFEMAHRAAREANVALRRMNELLEEQRRRISHELHDQAGQFLASVYLALDEMARDLPPAALARVQTVKDRLDQVEEQLRRLSHELRPTILDDLGLLPALELLAEGVSGRHAVTINVSGPRDARFPSAVETALYRVAQEALNNVAKHARASHVELSVAAADGKVCCIIRDDGIGLPPATRGDRIGGLGLIGMRERLVPLGGTLRIDSAPGAGTEISAAIPLPREARAGPVVPGEELGPSPY
jgi:signal transduction histidine kinase